MNFNNINATGKAGQTNLELRLAKKDLDSSGVAITQPDTPASKTFLTESSSKKVSIKDPYQELSDFMKMTDAQKMQYLWLKKHGISPEEFESMSGEDKQKLVEKMQQDLEAQMKKAIESPESSSSSLV
jgi:predicted flavoprotein YhiN